MKHGKVAIIDDNEKFLSRIKSILLMSGYIPVLVNDAFLAVDTVVRSKPDVILVELRMPGKNGFELTDSINRICESRKVPLIAMSDSFKDEFHWLLDLCGIKRRLKKPFQPLDVIWAIENEIG
jgi:CheY-like chemotaxis protein